MNRIFIFALFVALLQCAFGQTTESRKYAPPTLPFDNARFDASRETMKDYDPKLPLEVQLSSIVHSGQLYLKLFPIINAGGQDWSEKTRRIHIESVDGLDGVPQDIPLPSTPANSDFWKVKSGELTSHPGTACDFFLQFKIKEGTRGIRQWYLKQQVLIGGKWIDAFPDKPGADGKIRKRGMLMKFLCKG